VKAPEIKQLTFNTGTREATIKIELLDTMYVDEKDFPKLINGKLLLNAIRSALNENEAKHNNPGEKKMMDELAATRNVIRPADNNQEADSSKVINLGEEIKRIKDDYDFTKGL
jgi:hypothetical protein